jgi:hypothetical protein
MGGHLLPAAEAASTALTELSVAEFTLVMFEHLFDHEPLGGAKMTRRYDDLVDVRRRDEAPAEFLWRGRLYVVRDVLDHWVETGAWWRAAPAQALLGTDNGTNIGGGGTPGDSGYALPRAVEDGEREVWRVEASAGRARGSGVYDLCFDWSAGAWTLARTLD